MTHFRFAVNGESYLLQVPKIHDIFLPSEYSSYVFDGFL